MIYYLEAEYSDTAIEDIVSQIKCCVVGDDKEPNLTTIRDCEKLKDRQRFSRKWLRKIDEIIRIHQECDKHPPEAAKKVMDILKAITGREYIS